MSGIDEDGLTGGYDPLSPEDFAGLPVLGVVHEMNPGDEPRMFITSRDVLGWLAEAAVKLHRTYPPPDLEIVLGQARKVLAVAYAEDLSPGDIFPAPVFDDSPMLRVTESQVATWVRDIVKSRDHGLLSHIMLSWGKSAASGGGDVDLDALCQHVMNSLRDRERLGTFMATLSADARD